jgi:membrane fusion protein (multidrug efflux system)
VTVAVQAAEMGSISAYYRATASLEVENEAVIEARVSGTVREVRAEEGDEVRAGQVVLRIDPREFQLRAQQADAQADKERNRFDRAKKMFEQNLVSEQEFSAARSDLAAAEATLELSKLELSYTDVTAPFGGQVVRRTTDIGRTVGPGDPLFALADIHPLLARVHVPAKEFRSLRTDQSVDLILDSSGTLLKGRISLISPIIDPNTGTIKLTVEIDDYPPDTRPGDFAEVQIVTERRDDVLLVPKIAVVSEKGERFVYTPSDSVAVRRVVEVGFEDEDSAQILLGLDPGERVVVQGQRSLEDGVPIRILEAMTFEDDPTAS